MQLRETEQGAPANPPHVPSIEKTFRKVKGYQSRPALTFTTLPALAK